jgi:hypothetical protein
MLQSAMDMGHDESSEEEIDNDLDEAIELRNKLKAIGLDDALAKERKFGKNS